MIVWRAVCGHHLIKVWLEHLFDFTGHVVDPHLSVRVPTPKGVTCSSTLKGLPHEGGKEGGRERVSEREREVMHPDRIFG